MPAVHMVNGQDSWSFLHKTIDDFLILIPYHYISHECVVGVVLCDVKFIYSYDLLNG